MKQSPYNPNFLATDNELRSYFLGLWITDGWIEAKKPYARISSIDDQIINDLVKVLEFKNKILLTKNRKMQDRSQFTGTIQKHLCFSGKIPQYLRILGFSNKKTGNEFVPDCISDSTFPHFIRGVIDGDGTFLIAKDRNQQRLMCSIVSASEKFLQQILDRLLQLGVIGSNSKVVKNKTCYCIRFGHEDSIRIGDFIYKDAFLKLDRKYLIYLRGKELPIRQKRSWTSTEVQQIQQGIVPIGRTKRQCECKLWHLQNT